MAEGPEVIVVNCPSLNGELTPETAKALDELARAAVRMVESGDPMNAEAAHEA